MSSETDDIQVELPLEEPPVPEVEVADPPVKKATPPAEEDLVRSLNEQLEATKRAKEEAIARADRSDRDRLDAISKAQQTEITYKNQTYAAHAEAINSAIASAKSDLEASKRELREAINQGDPDAQAEAHHKMVQAEGRLARLEDGKDALETQAAEAAEEAKRMAEEAKTRAVDPIEAMQAPDEVKQWLRDHREFVTNPRKNLALQEAHYVAVEDHKLKPFSPEYVEMIEKHLGIREPDVVEEVRHEEPARRPIVSAPVSREGNGKPGSKIPNRIRLSEAEVAVAKASGVSLEDYAKNKLLLEQYKKNGHYGEGR